MARGAPRSWVVISLGGSVVVPSFNPLPHPRTHALIRVVRDLVAHQWRIALVVGGGIVARAYQQAAADAGVRNDEALDWIGVRATHLNAQLIASFLPGATMLIRRTIPRHLVPPTSCLVAGGTQPGQSTDAVAVRLARSIGAARIINVSNTPFVYDRDPRATPRARAFRSLSWGDYLSLIPSRWQPGLSVPFDPVAARLAQRTQLTIAMVGPSPTMLRRAATGAPFRGTLLGAPSTRIR